MAGVQIVLHRKNEEGQKQRNETRNLGLQSIIDREDKITSELISDASKQGNVAAQIRTDIQRLNSIVLNLNWAANAIYEIITDAYISDTSKSQKYIDIQQGAPTI
ncbi:MAG: hypothetical protein II411_02345 [Lachnospiraceae bacterium]|nr:hypothetical protein [Lachnospiraceae bacterium]